MNSWTDTAAPRIWRCPQSLFTGDEPMNAERVYTPEVLADIQAQGFNGVWLRGRLYELMQSAILPQLNDEHAEERRTSLRNVIQRANDVGLGVYLFFNEPLGLSAQHPLWQAYPELRGAPYRQSKNHDLTYAMCTSAPLAKQFFPQAIESLLDELPGLAGVILITASEYHSHCWSHTFRYSLDDGIDHGGSAVPDCPRCRDREPGEIALELLDTWGRVVREHAPACRVMAWNWSWSMWYPDPQAPITSQLPEGVELLVDWERGGQLERPDESITIDEYSLSYPGPSHRFLVTQAAAPSDVPVHAKLQIGTTHEIATVPNLPLMHSLHTKFAGLTQRGVAGTMACWNFGCGLTLNTHALSLYLTAPDRYQQADAFLDDLAQEYFGIEETAAVRRAWEAFDDAFRRHYPFSIVFVYWSPVNDAPAHPLSLEYRAQHLGASHLPHEFGDDVQSCLGSFTIDYVVQQLERLITRWDEGLHHYEEALEGVQQPEDPSLRRHRGEELSCARMISLQMRSALNFFRFHRRRLELTGDSNAPCSLPPDGTLLEIMQEEIANASAALPLVEADERLGYHQESHTAMYDAQLICAKIEAMRQELAAFDVMA